MEKIEQKQAEENDYVRRVHLEEKVKARTETKRMKVSRTLEDIEIFAKAVRELGIQE